MKLAYYTAGRFPDIDWKKKKLQYPLHRAIQIFMHSLYFTNPYPCTAGLSKPCEVDVVSAMSVLRT